MVVVVPGLAHRRQGEPGEVPRLVAGLIAAAAEDVAEGVDAVGEVVEHEDPHQAAPEQPGSGGEPGAADQVAEDARQRQAEHRPEDEGAIDEADHRVLEEVRGVALLGAAVGVDEEPAHVGVEEAAQRPFQAAAVADVGAVRVSLVIGECVVAAMVGDPGDHRPLDRG
jgi:hypothetical protein